MGGQSTNRDPARRLFFDAHFRVPIGCHWLCSTELAEVCQCFINGELGPE
jgi:hypothetical protein